MEVVEATVARSLEKIDEARDEIAQQERLYKEAQRAAARGRQDTRLSDAQRTRLTRDVEARRKEVLRARKDLELAEREAQALAQLVERAQKRPTTPARTALDDRPPFDPSWSPPQSRPSTAGSSRPGTSAGRRSPPPVAPVPAPTARSAQKPVPTMSQKRVQEFQEMKAFEDSLLQQTNALINRGKQLSRPPSRDRPSTSGSARSSTRSTRPPSRVRPAEESLQHLQGRLEKRSEFNVRGVAPPKSTSSSDLKTLQLRSEARLRALERDPRRQNPR